MPESFDDWRARAEIGAKALPTLPTYAELLEAAALGPGFTARREALRRDLGYVFWNRELVDCLAGRLQGCGIRAWLEVAAGNGRLTAELARRGLHVAASDSGAQAAEAVQGAQRAIAYPAWVAPLDGIEAARQLAPQGILTVYPPLGADLVVRLLTLERPALQMLVLVGEPGGASDVPAEAAFLPRGWSMEMWEECHPWLVSFSDPVDPTVRQIKSYSKVVAYQRSDRLPRLELPIVAVR